MLKNISRRLSSKNTVSQEDDRSLWGPVLITIGPQCSGKTTFVQNLGEPVAEFVLEDSAGIVEKAPVNYAIHMWSKDFTTEEECPEVTQTDRKAMSTVYYGISLENRLSQMSNSEQMILTLLFNREITFGYFQEKVEGIIADEALRRTFIEVCSEIYDQGKLMTTPHLEVVIVEALADVKARVAVEVDMAMRTNPNLICWGNTNLSPDFYKETLSFAAKNSRVVRFIRWGQELPSVPLRDLMVRNVKRFLRTGRYASIAKLALFHQHAERQKSHKLSHYECARAAGYEMDMMGRVSLRSEDSEKKAKAARRMSTGSNVSSGSEKEFKETRWSKWTNENQVYRLVENGSSSPVAAEEVDEKLIGDDGRVINGQSAVFRSLDGQDTPQGSLSGRRAKPFDGESPVAEMPVATPTREQSDNPFACILCFRY